MPDLTDTQAIIDAAREGVEPFPVPGLADVYTLGYRLDRPSEVQGAAFDDVLSEIRSASGLPVMVGSVTP